MRRIVALLSLVIVLSGCEWWQDQVYGDQSLPRIRNQADVDAYNATVSSESEKLVCQRERVVGSNLSQLVCLTVAQRERMAEDAQEAVREINSRVLTN
ncbi:MAG: hypothetical protein GKR91_12355 [Pseudomonadales bacterium]|nr:hypothetical protein [Pseudomonadales bacterium]